MHLQVFARNLGNLLKNFIYPLRLKVVFGFISAII